LPKAFSEMKPWLSARYRAVSTTSERARDRFPGRIASPFLFLFALFFFFFFFFFFI
jgi:hypothetical protein